MGARLAAEMWVCALLFLCNIDVAYSMVKVNAINETVHELESVEILYIGKRWQILGARSKEIPFVLGGSMTLITEPITREVSMDINQVNNRIFMVRNFLAIDELVVKAQENGAVGVIYVTATFCKYNLIVSTILTSSVDQAGYLKFRFNDWRNLKQIQIPVFELAVVEGRTILSMYSNDSIASVSLIPSGTG